MLREQIEMMDGMRDAFAGFFEDVVGGTKSIEDSFKSMLTNIAAMITRAIAQKWVEQLFGAYGSNQSGSAGGWMQAIAGLFAGGRSGGGGVSSGHLYRVNERGVETLRIPGREDYLMTGDSSGHVLPAGSGGRSGTQVNNFNFAAPTSTKTQTQIASRLSYEQRRAARFGA